MPSDGGILAPSELASAVAGINVPDGDYCTMAKRAAFHGRCGSLRDPCNNLRC